MLRDDLSDAAVSTAKAWAHAAVEPRHVVYAAARRLRERAEIGPLLDRARQALEPRGSSSAVPVLAPAAVDLLAAIATEQDAAAAVVAALAGSSRGSDATRASGGQAIQEGSASEVAVATSAPAGGKPGESVADILAELDGLIGLGAVKAQVRNVIAVVRANAERQKAGLPPVNPSLHLVFTGPPGTGKTTVARLVARLYSAAGALPGSGFTEASRADLVAGYVGQTAIKTTEIIARTRPGVLFIDEAYALASVSAVDFGHEAIATLVKAMEDYRSDLAVIVAGYAEEMEVFVGSNPGLRSRLKTYIAFPDYAAPELLEIFERFVRETGIALTDGAKAKAARVFDEVTRRPDFGNARFARSLFEQAYARMAARAAADDVVEVAELSVIEADDIELDVGALERERRRIGFSDGST